MVALLLDPPPASSGTHLPAEDPLANMQCDVRQRRLALVIEYQGTHYHGFQLQRDHPTIQGELEQALYSLTGQVTRIRAASRTDSGTHARAQVVDFLTSSSLPSEIFLRGLNSYLPPDIKVRGSYETSHDFHSRKSALTRKYRYTLWNSPTSSPLMREFSHWVRDSLNVASMNEAACALKGLHDFAPLSGVLPPGRSTVRNVRRWQLQREGEFVFMEAEADGFLPHQIRRAGGVLVEVGLGRLKPSVVQSILSGASAVPAWCAVLPAKGLCLMSIEYDDFPPESEGT